MGKKLICLDMDGTVYLGDHLFKGAKETFEYFKKNDISFVFLTNNSSHSLPFYVEKIRKMGIECNEDNFYSSIETTIKYLKSNNYKTIYVLGIKTFKDELKKHFNVLEQYDEKNVPEVVLASFDTELVYDELKAACLYIQKGSAFIATNMDYRCPIEDGLYIPDCGGMCEWIYRCTGKKATVMGKPNEEIIYYLAKQFNVSLDEVLVVGDRLYTDIQVAINAKVDSLAVLSGESSLEDINNYPEKPTYILDSIKQLPELLEK